MKETPTAHWVGEVGFVLPLIFLNVVSMKKNVVGSMLHSIVNQRATPTLLSTNLQHQQCCG